MADVKIIRLMADFGCATPFWDDTPVNYITIALFHRALNWLHDYQEHEFEFSQINNSLSFVHEGLEIANELRLQLPMNWIVMYFDESKSEYIEIK